MKNKKLFLFEALNKRPLKDLVVTNKEKQRYRNNPNTNGEPNNQKSFNIQIEEMDGYDYYLRYKYHNSNYRITFVRNDDYNYLFFITSVDRFNGYQISLEMLNTCSLIYPSIVKPLDSKTYHYLKKYAEYADKRYNKLLL